MLRVAEFQRIAAVGEWADGQVRLVGVAGKRIALVRAGDRWYAFDDRCTHAEVSLAGGSFDPGSLEIECPLHGARFDVVTGKPRCLPAVKALKTYPVRIVDGQVEIQVE